MRWPWQSKLKALHYNPKEWLYLGYTELRWNDAPSDYIHFLCRGKQHLERKVEYAEGRKTLLSLHSFHAQAIIPWLKDPASNLYTSILFPSDTLKMLAMEEHGYKYVNDVWVKPAPQVERADNIIKADFNQGAKP